MREVGTHSRDLRTQFCGGTWRFIQDGTDTSGLAPRKGAARCYRGGSPFPDTPELAPGWFISHVLRCGTLTRHAVVQRCRTRQRMWVHRGTGEVRWVRRGEDSAAATVAQTNECRIAERQH